MTISQTTPNASHPTLAPLATGTHVLSIIDAEPGHILNGYAYDPAAGGWTEYEIETVHGLEVWRRGDLLLFGDLPTDE